MAKKRIKVCPDFYLDEIVPPSFHELGVEVLEKIDERILTLIQFCRDKTGKPVEINTWWNGGQFDERGLRDENTSTGAPKSMHKCLMNKSKIIRKCMAVDMVFAGKNANGMFAWVNENLPELYAIGVRRVEDPAITGGNSGGWLHLDMHEHGMKNTIQVITKTKVIKHLTF